VDEVDDLTDVVYEEVRAGLLSLYAADDVDDGAIVLAATLVSCLIALS
jgi:hypothetical protein